MVLDQTANFVRGTVTSSIGTSDPETISVSDASQFPDPSTTEYNVVVWDETTYSRPDEDTDVEVGRVTGRDTTNDTLTISRGQEGTSNTSHPSNSGILLDATSKMFDDVDTTFGNFWDAANSELTADVNNAATTTNALTASGVHVIEPSADFATQLTEHGGETIDLGGETFVVSFLDDSIPSDTTIQNGTLKLGDNEDTDFIYGDSTTSGVSFRDVTFDFNGANNTTSPTNDAWWTWKGDALELRHCTLTNAAGRSSGDFGVWIDSVDHTITDSEINLGSSENHLRIQGSAGRRASNKYKNNNLQRFNGPDTVEIGSDFNNNSTGVDLAGADLLDMLFIGCNVEDNETGVNLSSPILNDENILITGKIQGNSGQGVRFRPSSDNGGRLTVKATFKRNQFESGGSGPQVRFEQTGNATVIAHAMTNQSANDAAWGFYINSGVTGIAVEYEGLNPGDFSTAIYSDNGTYNTVNGMGSESASAETPTASEYDVGDAVDFTDSGDGSGTGVYRLLPDRTWTQIGT